MRTSGWLVVMFGTMMTLQANPGLKTPAAGVVREDDPNPLPGLVTGVLEKQKTCVVQLAVRGAGTMTLHRWDAKLQEKLSVRPLLLTVNEGLEINSGPAMEELTLPEIEQRLRMYKAAVEAAGDPVMVRIRVERNASDLLFRRLLYALRKAGLDKHVYVEKFRPNPKPGLDPRVQPERFRRPPRP